MLHLTALLIHMLAPRVQDIGLPSVLLGQRPPHPRIGLDVLHAVEVHHAQLPAPKGFGQCQRHLRFGLDHARRLCQLSAYGAAGMSSRAILAA